MNKRILLIFPKLGPYDRIVKDMPLSLIYAARIVQREGFSVKIVDQRIESNWRQVIAEELKKEPILAGISVMTGSPIAYALEISDFIKKSSNVPVVWGGIHPTIMPEQTILNENIDILVRGEGEITLQELARALFDNAKDLRSIKGISYKNGGNVPHNQPRERMCFEDLPLPHYDLVDFENYTRFESSERYFSILTSSGCPHRCGFCYSRPFNRNRWRAEPLKMTLDHLGFIMDKYHPTYFSVIDSDFFVDLDRVHRIFSAVEKNRWKVCFGFRGVRVDELAKVDSELFSLMQRAGVKHLHIGAESGSQRMLDLMQKDISVEQTLEVNRRLVDFPGITPTYNFFSGVPTETDEDIKCSTNLILRLIRDNRNCLITAYNQFTPYPGTVLYDLALRHGLKPPEALEDWTSFDQSAFVNSCPWLTPQHRRLLDMLYFTTIFIDRKVSSLFVSRKPKYRLFRLLSRLYRPLARFRLKNHFANFFLEGRFKPRLNDEKSIKT